MSYVMCIWRVKGCWGQWMVMVVQRVVVRGLEWVTKISYWWNKTVIVLGYVGVMALGLYRWWCTVKNKLPSLYCQSEGVPFEFVELLQLMVDEISMILLSDSGKYEMQIDNYVDIFLNQY